MSHDRSDRLDRSDRPFPRALLERKQWVAALITPDPARPGKSDKVPYNPHTGGRAATDDPTTWGTYEQAVRRVEQLAAGHLNDGVKAALGFVFTKDDPFTGIDFDGCFDEYDTLDEVTMHRIDALDSYTERSISGRGVHVIVEAVLPPGGRKKGAVELYDRGRFFVLTGDVLFGKRDIAARQAAVEALHRTVFGEGWTPLPASSEGRPEAAGSTALIGRLEAKSRPADRPERHASYELDDDALLARAFTAANGDQFTRLWRGDISCHPSHSEADLALAGNLAFWTHNDPVRIDRLFRRSGLYRPKWDEKHFGDGTTYGQATISKATKGVAQPYGLCAASTPAQATPAQAGGMRYDDGLCAAPAIAPAAPAPAGGMRYDADAPAPAHVDVPELPKHVLYPPELAASAAPWLDGYIDYSERWAPRAYRDAHEAVGLWVASTVAARRAMTHLGGPRYTNLYLANVARSSVWTKTTAAKIGEELLRAAGLDFLLAPDDATPQGFIMAISGPGVPDWDKLTWEQQERLRQRIAFAAQRGWAYDEFGSKVDGMMRENGPMADFRGLLRRFDDCPLDYEYVTTSRGPALVTQPYLSLMATMTPADLAKHARQGGPLWLDGFWARFAFVSPPPDALPALGRFPLGERRPPQWLVDKLVEYHRRLGIPEVTVRERGRDDAKKGARPEWDVTVDRPAPVVLQLGEGVVDGYYRYHDSLVSLAAASNNPDLDGNYSRFAEKALRNGLLLASVEGRPTIELKHWARGQEIAERWRAGLHNLYAAVNSGQTTPQAMLEDRIMGVIEHLRVASASEICRYIKGEARTMIAATLERLARSGLLDIAEVSRKGTPRYAIPTGAEWK